MEGRYKYYVEVNPAVLGDSAAEDGVIDTSSNQHLNSKPLPSGSVLPARCREVGV